MTDGQFDVQSLKNVDLGTPPSDPNTPPATPPSDPNTPPADPNTPPADPATPPAEVKTPEQIAKEAREAFIKEMGFATEEEFKAFKEKHSAPQETPEQKAERERQYVAEMDAWMQKNNILTKDEMVALENLKKQTPEQIVYNEFAQAYKTKNPEATDEAIRSEFRTLYHLDSEVAGVKEYGENLLNQKAEQIKNVLENKYNTGKTGYDAEMSDKARVPAFRTMLKTSIEQFVPARLELAKIGESAAGLDIKPEWKEEIEKAFVSKEIFDEFKTLPPAQMAEKMKERIEAYLYIKHRPEILSAVAEHFRAEGLEEGKKGATAPFPLRGNEQRIPVTADDKEELKKSDAKMAGLFG